MANNQAESRIRFTIDVSRLARDKAQVDRIVADLEKSFKDAGARAKIAWEQVPVTTEKVVRDISKDTQTYELQSKKWVRVTEDAATGMQEAFRAVDFGIGGRRVEEWQQKYMGDLESLEAFMEEHTTRMTDQYGKHWYEYSERQRTQMDKRRGQEIEREKAFGARLVDEMTKIGVLRGGLHWRFARAMGGAAIVGAAALMILQKAFQGVRKAVEATLESMEEMSRVQAAERAFKSLGAAVGTTSDEFVAAVRAATGYTVEEYDILTTANKQAIEGFGNLSNAMLQLAPVATAMAKAVGTEPAAELDTLIKALRDADTEVLESRYGFQGVSAALREKAKELGLTTDSLDDNTRSVVALNQVLPQTEGFLQRVGAAAVDTVGPMRNFIGLLEDWYKAQRDILMLDIFRQFGGTPADLQDMRERNELQAEMVLRRIELSYALEKNIISQEEYNDAVERHNRLADFMGKAWEWIPGRGRATLEEMRGWLEDTETLIHGVVSALGAEFAPGPKIAEQMEEVNRIVDENVRQWTLDFSEVMSLEKAGVQAERLGEMLRSALYDVIRETGNVATIEGEATVNRIGGYAEDMVDVLGDRLSDLAEEVSDMPWKQAAADMTEQLAEGRKLVREMVDEWTVDFAKFMPLDEARARAEELGSELSTRLEEAIRRTGDVGSAVAQVVIQDVTGMADGMFDYFETRIERLAAKALDQPWKEALTTLGELLPEQQKEAERLALQLAPYLPLSDIEDFAKATETLLDDWAELWSMDPDSLQAQYARERILHDAEKIADAIRDANKETKASTTSMKQWANAALLANLDLGEWAASFTIEHGGRTPLQAYARHEQPLVAAMIDKLWGEDFKRREGREPTDAEWRQHWFEKWMPLELWPGGPIAAPTGPEAERAKALLKEMGIEDYGDIFKQDWDKRHGLIQQMDTELTKREELAAALAALTEYINSIIPPTKPPEGEENGNGEEGDTGLIDTVIRHGMQEFQRGGLTRRGGLALLHPNELVIPLDRLTNSINMRLGAFGGGGLNIDTLNIPVNIQGGGTANLAASVQQAVVGAVRGRAGTEMLRAARRLGH